MTLEQKTAHIFTIDDIQDDAHSSGIDVISLIIVLICSLLIFTVILASIGNWIRRKRSRRLQEEQARDNPKNDVEDIELEVRTEEQLQTGKIKNSKNTKYSIQQDTSAKSEEKDSKNDKFSDRSNSISTTRQLFVNKPSVPKSSGKHILIDFMDKTSPNFDESEINHVDVSFKGGEGDRSMVAYERRIGNLPLNTNSKQIVENTLQKSLNNSCNENDNSKLSEDYENNEEENKDQVIRHHEKMSKNLYDYAGFEYNDKLNHDGNIFPLDNHHGIDDNPYMTADFVNAMEDYDNDDYGNNIEKFEEFEKTDRKDSFGMQNDNNKKNDERSENINKDNVAKKSLGYFDDYSN